jgi:tight adherence protein B
MLKYLALLLAAGAAALLIYGAYDVVSTWWARRLRNYAKWVALEFESMFEDMSVERATRMITWIIFGAFLLGALVATGFWGRLIFGSMLAALGWFVPWVAVTYLRRRRLDAIDDQLVDALTMMANGLKAGLSLQQAMELVVREMARPISDEFARVLKEIHLGRLTDDALRRLTERVPLPDIRLAVDSILILRETGGNLSETFQVIAYTIVERKKVQGKIKSMTAQGMTQGIIICLFPIVMILLFSVIDPEYMRPFFTTPIGWMMMLLVFVLDSLGMWLMLKLVKVDV